MSEQKKPVTYDTERQLVKVTGAVSLYIVSSIAMIMINKAILKKIDLPLFFLWCQLLLASLILKVCGFVRLTFIPGVELDTAKKLLPLISVNILGLAFNTLCLHKIDAMMYQIARSLVLPITVMLNPFLGNSHISKQLLLSCAIIFVGFIIGVFGDRELGSQSLSLFGILCGVLSAITTSIHSFVIKSSFGVYESKGPFDLVYLNNILSAIFLVPFLIGEIVFHKNPLASFYALNPKTFSLGLIVSGFMGLIINYAGFLQIKVTSPLTHTVSSAARGVLQTAAAWYFLDEVVTKARLLGILVTLAGSILYSRVKYVKERDSRKGEALREYDRKPLLSKV